MPDHWEEMATLFYRAAHNGVEAVDHNSMAVRRSCRRLETVYEEIEDNAGSAIWRQERGPAAEAEGRRYFSEVINGVLLYRAENPNDPNSRLAVIAELDVPTPDEE